ncbi:hypothetical protein PSYPI_32348 [Pseudomonas syringae pv. pisi str. 1704B]|uniref:Uncharacterized protein n=1 Tax=Pseudomonas syringae pv. pisi str. 1704B TaxID=629263 RepID=F3GI35_PSESJ|nr:hypothetical protein PSYPI_32348 [Pseudomonas syringae pv. pisi str. 1704B]
MRIKDAFGGMATLSVVAEGQKEQWLWWAVCTSREPGMQKVKV